MSDHGFANFGRQFNLNSWLRGWGYLGPPECTSIMKDVDWSQTVAYGLGINGLYLNMKGRERDGIVEPGDQREALLAELIERLQAVTDINGESVIRGVYRSDKIYTGNATALAPDLIVGYRRGYRASWATRSATSATRSCSTTTWRGAPTTAPMRSRCRAFSSATAPVRSTVAVARRSGPVDSGRVRPAHAAADGREKRFYCLRASGCQGETQPWSR